MKTTGVRQNHSLHFLNTFKKSRTKKKKKRGQGPQPRTRTS